MPVAGSRHPEQADAAEVLYPRRPVPGAAHRLPEQAQHLHGAHLRKGTLNLNKWFF